MPLIFLHQDRPVKERRGRLYRSPRDVQRIAELEAALDWYANEDRYLRRGMGGEFDPEIMCDGGRRARALLPDDQN